MALILRNSVSENNGDVDYTFSTLKDVILINCTGGKVRVGGKIMTMEEASILSRKVNPNHPAWKNS